MSTQFTSEVLDQLAAKLKPYFASGLEFERLRAELANPSRFPVNIERQFSISTAIRGLARQSGMFKGVGSADTDLNFVQRALNTTSTPGSYLVPTASANEIIGMLSQASIFRAAGCQVWPMEGRQKLVVPTALTSPTVEWLGQNTSQVASDPTLGQLSFDLKTMRALCAVPNELLMVSTPAVDRLLSSILSDAAGEKEDTAFTATTTVSGGFQAIYAATSTTTSFVGGSANGGNLAYSDLMTILYGLYAAKAKPPFAFFMHPRTFFTKILSMIDLQSRPIIGPEPMSNINFSLFGYPVFVSANIPTNIANGSGTNQSWICCTNPKYVHLAEPGGIELAVSGERYFELNQTAVRLVRYVDVDYAPKAGIYILKGVN